MNRSGIHLNKWWSVAICAGLTLLAVLHLGQDRNWDLANYHLYNPHALLGGRYGFDIAPAQLQTWHNPMLDVPLYLLMKADMPGLLISLWLALPSMVALIAGNKVLGNLLDRSPAPWETAAFALIAITAPAMYSTLGSSMNDGFVAAAMLLALAIACRKGSGWRDWALAGLIAGGIAGLKLTALVYCIGLAASACARGPLKDLPVRLVALAIGGLAGFLVSYGFWGFYLWETHGNPLFPYLNQVFESPDVAPIAWADVRFRPDGIGEALLVPFRRTRICDRIALGGAQRKRGGKEQPPRDPCLPARFILAVGAAVRNPALHHPARGAVRRGADGIGCPAPANDPLADGARRIALHGVFQRAAGLGEEPVLAALAGCRLAEPAARLDGSDQQQCTTRLLRAGLAGRRADRGALQQRNESRPLRWLAGHGRDARPRIRRQPMVARGATRGCRHRTGTPSGA